MGDEDPRPRSDALHAMFSRALQVVGRLDSPDTPSPAGPRHCGQFAASGAVASTICSVTNAARHPEMYAWVGSVHNALDVLPRGFRRVVTRSPRTIVYYRHDQESDTIVILGIRGGPQLPPSPEELRSSAE